MKKIVKFFPLFAVVSILTIAFYNKTIPLEDPFGYFQKNKGKTSIKTSFLFHNVTVQSGITHKHEVYIPAIEAANSYPRNHMNASISVADYDNDGLVDLFFTTQIEGKKNYLYKNLGDWRFEDVTDKVGLGVDTNTPGNSVAAAFFDYNNDGWIDLYVVKAGCHKLFKNIKGRSFIDVSQQLGIDKICGFSTGISILDYDKDGFLDVYISNFFDSGPIKAGKEYTLGVAMTANNVDGGPNFLLKNTEGKQFVNVAQELGVDDRGLTWATGIQDLNADGYPDMYNANDFGYDKAFLNHEGKHFTDITKQFFKHKASRNGMNVDYGDVKHNGQPMIYITNVSKVGLKTGANILWVRNGEKYYDIAGKLNLDKCGWGWGAKFFDVDRNGWLDLITVNGFWNNGKKSYWYRWTTLDALPAFLRQDLKVQPSSKGSQMAAEQKNCLFLANPNEYTDIAEESGITDTMEGRGIAIADLDNDGALDLVIANHNDRPILYKQTPLNNNNWVGLKLKYKHRDAIGAVVKATTKFTQTMQVYPTNGYASQSDSRVYFGLGDEKFVNIEVQWPNGEKQNIKNISINKYNLVTYDK